MSTSYPTSLDAYTNPTTTSKLNSPSHSGLHSGNSDAIEALEAKVGIDSSAVTTSHDYKLSGVTGTDKAVSKTGTETLTNKTLTAPVISTISNTGTLTLPTSTDTLVGRNTTDTFTNKTLTSPTMTTPTLGVATATSVNKVTITAPTTSATLTLVTGSSLITAGAYAITLTSTATTGVTLPTTGTLATLTGTETFTNKRITKRVVTTTDDSTSVINVDTTDVYELSAVANATEFTLTGTPTDGQTLVIRLKDAGVGKGLTWTGFTAIGVTLPTTTVASKWHYIGCMYNAAATQWQAIAVMQEA